MCYLPKAGEACRSDHASHGLDHRRASRHCHARPAPCRGVIRAAVGDFPLPTSTDHSLSGARDRPVWQTLGPCAASPPSIAISSGRPIMKKLGMLGIIGGAALLTVASPFSLQWSQDEVSLSLNSADARIGRPLTATNRRVYRRTYRRAAYAAAAAGVAGYGYGSYYGYSSPYYSSYYTPQPYSSYYGPVSSYAPSRYSCYLPPYASPPSRYSYYLPPFASVNSYGYLYCGR
jgi:hypothetical protein